MRGKTMLEVLKYDPYLQTKQCERWLEEKASQGLFIRELYLENDFVFFDKANPKKVHYSIFFDQNKKFNASEFIEILKEQGWKIVGKESSRKELYLFINEQENPIPIETDNSVLEYKCKNLLNLFVLNLVLSIAVVAVNLYTSARNPANWFTIFIYLYLSYSYFINSYRFAYLRNSSQAIKDRTVRIYRFIRKVALVITLLAFTYITFRYVEIKQVSTNINYLVKPKDTHLINEVYTKSIFSFNPNYTSIFTIKKDNQLNQVIYQTKVNITWLNNINFEDYHTEQTKNLKYEYPIKFNLIDNYLNADKDITYSAENRQEYYSFILVDKTIYTLHSINLTLNEHNEYLNQMGVR